LSVI
jgi:hypothetical protein